MSGIQGAFQSFRSFAPPPVNTAAWFAGGAPAPSPTSRVDRITYATDTATATVRGPLSLARGYFGAAGNTTAGWFGGGWDTISTGATNVQRITYATATATASVRGSLSLARYGVTAAGNNTDGWFGGGAPGPLSRVDRITYATDTATASVRGPLSAGKAYPAATGGVQ